ncbi:ABC transporter permease [Egicoccus halophilus]|uniref:Peptide ABC transporter permease n=1 Tax=Egicoccus halophilus TaxID=1670830 RepID=A0A8J3ABE5_9ACTN|nr:ABC transporter permease [Egicoccus halophilus]GGI03058.1 peptide ABC transporter permease [Egicoccus halophilus]
MARYVVVRTGQALLALLGVSIVVFALMHLVPGDPVRAALGTRFTPELYDALVQRAGLDRPLVVQYVDWLGRAVTGDLGVSFRTGDPVATMLAERIPRTALLAFGALLIGLAIALPAGILSAVRQGKPVDYAANTFAQIGVSIPDFWFGILGILVFARVLGWLPPGGYRPLTEAPLESLRYLLLPAATAGVVTGAILTRFVRSSVLEAMNAEHVRLARAKGLPSRYVLRHHVLRNAWIPIVTVTGLQLGTLLGGIVVVEIVFSWPGIGLLALSAVETRDYPVLQGAVLFIAAVFLVLNLLVDLLYARLDPRIRVGADA